MRRTYSIPAASGLGLSLSLVGGCGDPIVGDWVLTRFTSGTETYNLPYVYTYTYDGQTYTYQTTMDLSVNKELSATLNIVYNYDTPDGTSQDVSTYSLTAAKTAKREYSLTGTMGGSPLSLSCEVGDALNCTGTVGAETLGFLANPVP